MPSALERMAIEVTFTEVERQVYKLAWEFHERYRTDFSVLLSEAALGYAVAYRSYNPDLGGFTTWVHEKVSRQLMSYIRTVSRKRRLTQADVDITLLESEEGFNLNKWIHELSEDAQTVVKLVFSPNQNVKLSMVQLGGETPVNFRLAVKEFLEDMGWSHSKITHTFREIKEAL